jgi:AcrR family transcriptional regulator
MARPPRSASRGDAALKRLLDGSVETFVELGYRAAKIREICARSKVGIGTFYTHFEHKRELLKRVFLDRAVPLSSQMTPGDLLDHGRLVARLRAALDDRLQAGLLRAWHEAVLEEPAIARLHSERRAAGLRILAATIAEAQRRSSSRGSLDPSVLAWAVATLAREIAIHDRTGAPDLETLARLFETLVFGLRLAA